MTSLPRTARYHPASRHAFSMVEVVVSMAIVGVMLVASLNAVGASKAVEKKISDRARGMLLAQQLMNEILAQDYADADSGVTSFCIESGEGTGNRSLFDDVDDYDDWTASPPQYKDGTTLSYLGTGWARSVTVARVRPQSLTTSAILNTGVKRITVVVTRNGLQVASLVAIRTQGADKSGLRRLSIESGVAMERGSVGG